METRNYETVFITNPNAAETKVQDIKNRNQQIIENHNGKILNLDDWGKKKMAYAINKEPKGHYFCLTYSANNECVAEIERNMRINEEIFRFLTVKIDDKVDPMAAIAAYKVRLESHAKREKERAERDAERNSDRGSFKGGPREGGGRFHDRGDRPERSDRGDRPERGDRSERVKPESAHEVDADIQGDEE
ncbi:MAG: 30S ribosomal protein S6 [Oligoflexia bacterium]|nr:30S ribosomal protein S6 [Oligoflexia bacterium]